MKKGIYVIDGEKAELMLKGHIFTRKDVFRIVEDSVSVAINHAVSMLEAEGKYRSWKYRNILRRYLLKIHKQTDK